MAHSAVTDLQLHANLHEEHVMPMTWMTLVLKVLTALLVELHPTVLVVDQVVSHLKW